MVFEENFLRLTVTVCFQEMIASETYILLPIYQLISYYNVVVTKQIYFSPTF